MSRRKTKRPGARKGNEPRAEKPPPQSRPEPVAAALPAGRARWLLAAAILLQAGWLALLLALALRSA